MTDAWNGSWGVSWGVSWGSGTPIPPIVIQTQTGGAADKSRKEYLEWLKKKKRKGEALLEKNKNRFSPNIPNVITVPIPIVSAPIKTEINYEPAIKKAAIASILDISDFYNKDNLQKLAYNEIVSILEEMHTTDDEEALFLLM